MGDVMADGDDDERKRILCVSTSSELTRGRYIGESNAAVRADVSLKGRVADDPTISRNR